MRQHNHIVLGLLLITTLFAYGCGKSEGDLVPPSLSVTPPTAFPLGATFGPAQYPGPYVFGGSVEAGSTLQVTTDTSATISNLTVNATNWSAELNNPAQGTNTISVAANDSRGNLRIISFAVVFDSVVPAVTYNQYVSPSPFDNQIIGGIVESGATVTVAGNPATVTDGYWSYPLSGLAPGVHSLPIVAVDAAGNTSLPLSAVLTVDPSSPPLTITPPGVTSASTVTLNGTLPASGYTIVVTPITSAVGKGAENVLAGNWSCVINNLSAGNNVVAVSMRDMANNEVATANVVIVRDLIAPTVSTVTPTALSTVIAVPAQVSVLFSEQLDSATVSGTSFYLKDANNNLISATVNYVAAQLKAILTPAAPLANGSYTATLTTALKDSVGNSLSADYSWTFSVNAP